MNDFEKNLIQYFTDFPEVWSFLWSPEEAENIVDEHKDQIHFLNTEGTKFIKDYFESSGMNKGFPEFPFKNHFKKIEDFKIFEGCNEKLKKWLFDREIPFSKYVFIESDQSGQSVMLTWKMVIKYCEGIFFAEDLVIFDSSLNWGLFYYHEGEIYFGTEINNYR